MAKEYLDKNGLTYFWDKIKTYIDDHSAGGKFTSVQYSITTKTNTNVSPWSCLKSQNISSDITTYGTPVGIVVKTSAHNNPASACIVDTNLNVYSRNAGDMTVTVLYKK